MRVASVARLLTFVDVAEDDDGPDGRRMAVSARHLAVLEDGRRVVLLDGRGWSEELRTARDEPPRRELGLVEAPSPWAYETAEEIERTARFVVGPDEPFGDQTRADMEASHWESLARVLRQEGVDVGAAELRVLPHDIQLGDRVLARVGVSRRPPASRRGRKRPHR